MQSAINPEWCCRKDEPLVLNALFRRARHLIQDGFTETGTRLSALGASDNPCVVTHLFEPLLLMQTQSAFTRGRSGRMPRSR
jgi:hypothetical protein